MKRFFVLFLLLTLNWSVANAQLYTWKDFGRTAKSSILSGSFAFVSGCSNGLHETLLHHYDRFEHRFPNANDQYWNPEISWKNKYKNGNPADGRAYIGSTGILVWTTDGYHLTNTVSRTTLFISGCTFIIGRNKCKRYNESLGHKIIDIGVRLGITYLSYTAGFHLVYNKIFK